MSSGAIHLLVLACWVVWFYPFVLRAPLHQKRASITVSGPTFAGLFFELAGIGLAFALRLPADSPSSLPRIAASCLFALLACVIGWTSVTHLGKQFRLRAGLYTDHELVRTGPYGIVRHPIYASLLTMLISTMLALTPWQWMPLPLAVFVIGTEIRVRTEDGLLASRFGDQFLEYRRSVPAYVPLIR
jgi:protein-S-isoprenylcysteine O-methyltransferase Ste14